jgi:hypothetical protein
MKKSASKFIVFGSLLLMVASACAAPTPTASAPTLVPPTLAPTLPSPAATLAPPTLAATLPPPTLAPTADLLALVTDLQTAYNKGDTDGIMALFVTDPNWSVSEGMFGAGSPHIAATAKDVRDTLEIGFALNSQLEASGCSTKDNQATCALVIKDDCNPPTAAAYHIRVQFAFQEGKIASVFGRWDVSDENAFAEYDSARQDWARVNLPVDSAAYNAYLRWDEANQRAVGLAPGETASQLGQAVERMCKGYTAAGH